MWSKFCDINQASVEAEQKKPADCRFVGLDWEKTRFFIFKTKLS